MKRMTLVQGILGRDGPGVELGGLKDETPPGPGLTEQHDHALIGQGDLGRAAERIAHSGIRDRPARAARWPRRRRPGHVWRRAHRA